MSERAYPMNREQRRAHYRENKTNPSAVFCPRCNHKTRHVALPMDKNYALNDSPIKDANVECNIVCSAFGNVLRSYIKGVTPYEYVKAVDKT